MVEPMVGKLAVDLVELKAVATVETKAGGWVSTSVARMVDELAVKMAA